ncbi:MAG: metalloregulator ArsR/SmtB family transcription factor [Phycisphaerales bacterium]|nr:metalloregulator ArsR/SmtB family transcription factor [Phycisphaerales bacterium]
MRDTQFVKIAKALADATRHRMLMEIRDAGELNCSQVCERFPLSQPTISHHIKTLAEAGVIKMRKEGQFHVISVDEQTLSAFAADIVPAPIDTEASPAKKRAKPAVPRE